MNFCFDCDDTLYDMRSPFDQARAEVLPGLQADPEAFYTQTRAFSEEIFDQVQDGTLTVDQSGVLRIRKACEWWGQPVTLAQAEAFQAAYRRAQTEIRMAPELEEWLASCDHLDENGMPSMAQDVLAKRQTEVELFAGEVCKRAKHYGMACPINEALYRDLKEIEAQAG